MKVDPGLVIAAAAHTDAESRAVLAGCSAADAALEAASFGWVGASRAALARTAERWSATTTDLGLRLYRHGETLRVSALTFAAMDAGHSDAVSAVRPPEPR